jgi:hypothetical protein
MKTTSRERAIAVLLNLGAIPFPYMGPIIGLAVGGNSKYVRFHAYRCLIEQVVATVIIGVLMVCSLAFSVYQLWKSGTFANGFDVSKIDWAAIIIKGVITWLLLAIWGLWNTFNSIRDALQANSGLLPKAAKWSEKKAMKMSGITNSPQLADSSESLRESAQIRS